MHKIPPQYRWLFSKGSPWIEERLHKYAEKVSKQEALFVTKKLCKEIEAINEQIVAFGIPSHLQLCHVNRKVHTGVFLKYDSPPILTGDLIGIYTGIYELVSADLSTHNAYAYDVAQGIRLSQKQLSHISRWDKPVETKDEYCVQTNALEAGNFTRFINHSSLHPNIEAVVCRLPQGKMEVLLFALKDIEPGQQLLSNYGGQYWKALGFIPDDMTPDTYVLDNPYEAHKVESQPTLPRKEELLALRNPSITTSEQIQKSKIFHKFKQSLPSMPGKKHREKIEEWEGEVLERGMPRSCEFSRKALHSKQSVKKGDFVGLLGGTLSLEETSSSILLMKKAGHALYIDLQKEGNCLQWMTQDCIEGNVKLYPLYDEETDLVFLVLLAAKDIAAGEKLVFRS